MRRFLVFLLTACASLQVWPFSWNDLWYTPDQQGQQLMDKGQFLKAKETFEHNDWAASAAYRAGDYEKASQLFKELNTELGYYNQGNALAHMGKYEQAIEAYDKALKLNPNDPDTLYNRKLVYDLLKKDKEQNKQDNKQKNKDQKNQDKKNQDQKNQDQKNQDQKNQDQKNQDQKNQDQKNQDQKNQDQKNQDQKNQDQKNQDQKNQDQKNQDQKNQDQKNQDQKSQDQKNQDQKSQDQKSQDQKNQDQNKKDEKQEEGGVQSEADQEKQQAKEQWLRLIPDDPGGLMREKFLRDHLRRERGWYQ